MSNTFENMEKAAENEAIKTKDVPNEKLAKSTEIDLDQLSDTAVGDKVKYERESLDGQVVEIKSAKIFSADTSEEPKDSMSGNTQYYSCNFILTYDKQNKDGVDHREYISGLRQFVQRDGSLSEPSFWYDGAENQCAQLWEAVAKVKGIEPKDLTPRQFLGYLNSGVKAKIKLETGKFKGKNWEKNLVEEFVA